MFDSNWIYKIEDREDIDIISELLKLRGVEDIDNFLNPAIDKLHSPFLLNDMDKAVKRIITAIENKEKIYIYGDYDADGLTSAAILVRFFKSLEIDTRYFIPDRFDDGYGLSIESLQTIIKNGAQLVITTDCGVNSIKEVEYLKQKGIDIIITDHHQSTGELPDAKAVICCTRYDNTYPYMNLSGAGIAFKLTEAINQTLKVEKRDKNLLLLAAIGTVADIVKLDGENRVIVTNGLKLIKESANVGIDAILSITSVERAKVDTYTLGFIIGPHINAAGRMGKAYKAMDILLCDNLVIAEKMAMELALLNNKRKSIQDKIFEKILGQLIQNPEISNSPVIVAGGENYNKGVIGIVAAKIRDIYKKPTIIYTIKNGIAECSGRSLGEFSLINSLVYCDEVLDKYGGHKYAVGLALNADKINLLRVKLSDYALENKFDSLSENKQIIDLNMNSEELNNQFINSLNILEPFGKGNSKPIFSLLNVELGEYRRIGANGKHLSFTFKHDDLLFKAVSFNSSDYEPLLFIGEKYNIAFNAEINNFKGKNNIQLMIKDISLANYENETINIIIVRLLVHMIKYKKNIMAGRDIKLLSGELFRLGMPTAADVLLKNSSNFKLNREDVAFVFTKLKQFKSNSEIDIRNISTEISIEKLVLIIEILIELGILMYAPTGMYKYMIYGDVSRKKKNLTDSAVYRVFSEKEG